MRETGRMLLFSIVLGFMLACIGTPAPFLTLTGLWIMDEGDLALIGRAAFFITKQGEGFTITFGEMTAGEFIPEDGVLPLEPGVENYNLEIDGDFIEIEINESGLLFRRGIGDSYITYHFRKWED